MAPTKAPLINVDALQMPPFSTAGLLVDVRAGGEFAVSHATGARSLPLERLQRDGWPAEWPTDRPVVTYCTVGYRSGLAAELLRDAGIDAMNLRGGILAWAAAGRPLSDADGPTKRVHVWSGAYAWVLSGSYEPVTSD